MDDNSNVEASEDPPNEDGDPRSTANELRKLTSPPLSESEKVGGDTGSGPDVGSDDASQSEALGDRERLRELQESLGRLEEFAASAQAENTTRAYAADLEDFRHWCKRMDREWLPAGPETIGLYLGARADELSLATLERRLAAIASLHKEEGYESPASVADGPLRKIWKGIIREKTRQQDGAPPLMVEDLRSILEHLPRYSSSDEGPAGELTLTALRDKALLLVGWTGALRRSELVALTTADVEFVEGKGVNVYVRQSKADQEGTGLVKGLPYGSKKETCPVTALRQWLQAAERNVEGSFEGDIFRRFYRGESVGESAMTAQYVSTVLKRHAESAGLGPDKYSAHSLRAGFITQAIRAGKPERRVKEHSGHASWETFNQYVEEAGTFQDNPAEGIGL
ncbi:MULTISPECIES: site-specific integrase [Salinibacter]|uniref:Site-specific recombinase XerD n=1 Tax=Salinibacter ruber TaxID=146919 RepID=A0A9X2V7Q8_9BACT|nr:MULTISPECIES: site-specific integrase [Salinibacter]MCS3698508.1 site-specific recombinase XerD [Salinibacter ruber]MCS4122663.1 site-specific recombinase XerD [Salinibacter ruber]MCS4136246.1 site-specific recombinase XerD [Salinibacter ruber]